MELGANIQAVGFFFYFYFYFLFNFVEHINNLEFYGPSLFSIFNGLVYFSLYTRFSSLQKRIFFVR